MADFKLKTGVFPDIPNHEYHAIDAVGSSYLKKLRICPAEAKIPHSGSGDKSIGSACHILELEGEEEFKKQVIELEVKGANTVAFKTACAENPESVVVTKGVVEEARKIVDGMRLNPLARHYLDLPGDNEHSAFWQDPDTGLWCKSRFDRICREERIIIDLKFVQKGKADVKKFFWMARDFGYDISAAHYMTGATHAAGFMPEGFIFIVVEKDPPYRTEVLDMDPDWIDTAYWENKKLIELEAECRKNDFWPNFKYEEPELLVGGF